MALQVSGKTALVTGGGSGICLAFTKLLLQNNCNVVIADVQLIPEAEELVKKTAGEKVRVVYQKTDVMDWAQLEAAFARAMEEFGSLDVVCPGAGIFEPSWSSFWYPPSSPTASNSYKTLEINITHPIRATQLAIDSFVRQGHGHGVVLIISSIAAQLPLLPVPMYAASKAAISSFVRSLGSLEQQLNIRISGVAPAIVQTPIWTEDKRKWMEEGKDEWCSPQRVAEVMMDVVQKEEYVGGTVLEIGVESVRMIEGVNDPGPAMGTKGFAVSKLGDGFAETFGLIEKNFGK